MAISETLKEMIDSLNPTLVESGFCLVPKPHFPGKVELDHAEFRAAADIWEFLNVGRGDRAHRPIVFGMNSNKTTVLVECGFAVLLTGRTFVPAKILPVLLEAGEEARGHYAKWAESINPLHRKLLEHRATITKAGFTLDACFYSQMPDASRILSRETDIVSDSVTTQLADDGSLVVTEHARTFHRAAPFTAATLK